MHLADDARRFDVSPAWLSWVGTAAALRLFSELDMTEVRDHNTGLANRLRAELGKEPANRAVVSLPDPDGSRMARLHAAGVAAAARAGRIRIAFHLWNDLDDVKLVLEALH